MPSVKTESISLFNLNTNIEAYRVDEENLVGFFSDGSGLIIYDELMKSEVVIPIEHLEWFEQCVRYSKERCIGIKKAQMNG